MSDQADIHYPIQEHIAKRWSPRAFSDQPVSQDALHSLLEAARWAPSCFNEQPWGFLVATKDEPEAFKKMLDCLMEGNQVWAGSAPVLMLTVARCHFSRNDKPNRHAGHDLGLAVGQMGIQAQSMGLYMHQMGGIFFDKIREVYNIPDSCEPLTGIAIGYLGDSQALPEHLAEREAAPRTRHAQDQFVFRGSWGNQA